MTKQYFFFFFNKVYVLQKHSTPTYNFLIAKLLHLYGHPVLLVAKTILFIKSSDTKIVNKISHRLCQKFPNTITATFVRHEQNMPQLTKRIPMEKTALQTLLPGRLHNVPVARTGRHHRHLLRNLQNTPPVLLHRDDRTLIRARRRLPLLPRAHGLPERLDVPAAHYKLRDGHRVPDSRVLRVGDRTVHARFHVFPAVLFQNVLGPAHRVRGHGFHGVRLLLGV